MTNEHDRIEINRTKISFFLREKIKAHIDKTDKTFFNGFFLEELEPGIYLFKDDVLGEEHVFLSDIYKVDNFREPKERPKFNNF